MEGATRRGGGRGAATPRVELGVLLGLPDWYPRPKASSRSIGVRGDADQMWPDVEQLAAGHRRGARATRRTRRRTIDLAKRERWPVPTVTAGTVAIQNYYSISTQFGITVPIPMFDWGQGKIARAKARSKRATPREGGRHRVDARPSSSARCGCCEHHKHVLADVRSDVAREAARCCEQMAEDSFRAGDAELIDLLDATRTRFEVELTRIDLLEATVEAEVDVLAVTGRIEDRGAAMTAAPTRFLPALARRARVAALIGAGTAGSCSTSPRRSSSPIRSTRSSSSPTTATSTRSPTSAMRSCSSATRSASSAASASRSVRRRGRRRELRGATARTRTSARSITCSSCRSASRFDIDDGSTRTSTSATPTATSRPTSTTGASRACGSQSPTRRHHRRRRRRRSRLRGARPSRSRSISARARSSSRCPPGEYRCTSTPTRRGRRSQGDLVCRHGGGGARRPRRRRGHPRHGDHAMTARRTWQRSCRSCSRCRMLGGSICGEVLADISQRELILEPVAAIAFEVDSWRGRGLRVQPQRHQPVLLPRRLALRHRRRRLDASTAMHARRRQRVRRAPSTAR